MGSPRSRVSLLRSLCGASLFGWFAAIPMVVDWVSTRPAGRAGRVTAVAVLAALLSRSARHASSKKSLERLMSRAMCSRVSAKSGAGWTQSGELMNEDLPGTYYARPRVRWLGEADILRWCPG